MCGCAGGWPCITHPVLCLAAATDNDVMQVCCRRARVVCAVACVCMLLTRCWLGFCYGVRRSACDCRAEARLGRYAALRLARHRVPPSLLPLTLRCGFAGVCAASRFAVRHGKPAASAEKAACSVASSVGTTKRRSSLRSGRRGSSATRSGTVRARNGVHGARKPVPSAANGTCLTMHAAAHVGVCMLTHVCARPQPQGAQGASPGPLWRTWWQLHWLQLLQ